MCLVLLLFIFASICNICRTKFEMGNEPDIVNEYKNYLLLFNKSLSRLEETGRLSAFANSFVAVTDYNTGTSNNFVLNLNEFSDFLDDEKSNLFSVLSNSSFLHKATNIDNHRVQKKTLSSTLPKSINWANSANAYGSSFVSVIRNQVLLNT